MFKLKHSGTWCGLLAGLFLSTNARAIYVDFFAGGPGSLSGSDIVTVEQRWPYWNGGYFNPWNNGGFTSSDGVGGYFYHGAGQPPAGSPPNVQVGVNWSFWPLSNPINQTDTITSVYSSPGTFSMKTTAEGTIFRSPGQWAIWNTNVWYRWTIRTWQPVNGTPHQGYAGAWLRDGTTGNWYHMTTVQLPFAVTGLSGVSAFQENASGSAVPQRTDYRNSYGRLNGTWKSANTVKDTQSSNATENFGLIENDTAVYLETCENNPNYVGTIPPINGSTATVVISNQPATPTFDPIVVTDYTASVSSTQLLVQWRIPQTSSPQFAYQVNVYTNASYTGPVVATAYDIAPEARQKLLTIPAGSTLYPQLTIIDVFNQTNSPVNVTATNASLSAATTVAGAVNGLSYAYYQSANNYFLDTQGTNWASMPNFAAMTPVSSGAVSGMDLSPRKRRTGYAFNYTGYLNVPANGIYAFTLNSDAGSKLYVDGQLVVNNDGRHSPTDLSGWIGLQAGQHALNVQYFCDTQSAMFSNEYFDTLSLSYEGPGRSHTVVPVTAFYRVLGGSEPTVSLTPTNGAVVSGASVPLNATVTANGNTINKVVFYNDNYFWGQDTVAPYSLNSFFWANTNNPLRARLIYNGTNTIDSAVNLVTTLDSSLAPWQYTQAFFHNTPNGASVQGGTYSLIGDGVNLLTRPVSGDCTLIARLTGITSAAAAPDGSAASTGWEAGIILRGTTNMTPGMPLGNSGAGNAPFVALFSQVDGGTYYQDEKMQNGGGAYHSGNLGGQKWFKLVRSNLTNFTSYLSPDGATWTLVNTTNITLATNVFTDFGTTLYAGFFTYAGPSSNPNVHWATFDNVSLTGNILGPPGVSVNPAADTVYAGQNATFTALPSGAAPFTYQWQLNGVNLADATNATLSLTNLQPSASGTYTVQLGNTNGAVSASGTLSVRTPPTPVQAIITNNPLGYWRLNESAGPTAYDSVGSFNGTGQGSVLSGVAGVTNVPFTGFESGNLGAQFNGDSSPSDISIPAFNVTTTNFTITGWVKCNGPQDSWSGLVFSRGSGHGVGLMVVNNGGNELRYSWNDNGNDYNAGTGFKLPSGQWAFVALTITPTNAIVYFATNSTLRSWTNTTANIGQTFAGNFFFGCDPNSVLSASRQFNGALDEIAIYNRTLTGSQISQVLSAAQTATPPSVSLTAPANGASYGVPANINLAASVLTNGHSITGVEFYSGETLLGTVSNPPYTLNWTNVPAGSYALLAQLTYDSGSTVSSEPAFVTVIPPPLAPATITPTAVAYNSINVTWSAAANASGYILNRNGSPIANLSGTSYSDTGLSAGTTYSYFVIATNAFGNSPPSVTNSATTTIYGAGLGLNFTEAGNATTGSADGLNPWDNVYNAGGTITLAGSSVWVKYNAANTWGAGSGTDPGQKLYVKYLDDGDNSLVNSDGIGVSVTISNLNSWVATNGGVGVKIRCYAASDTSGATFRPVSVRSGAPNPANGATQLTSLPVLQTVTIPVLGGGDFPTITNTDLGHPRGYADSSNVLTNDVITLTIPARNGSQRGSLAAIKLNVIMPVATTFTLTYNAGPNGSVSGTTPQMVNSGGNGSAVTAVANANYHFVNWSDGSTANPRTDSNVTNNITVTANFALNSGPLPPPWTTNKIGTITAAVNATVSGGTYSITGGGSGISGKNDNFWYVCQPCTNDVAITARVVSQQSASSSAQAGVMIRETLATGSRHAFIGLNPVNGANYIRRSNASGNSSTTTVAGRAVPYWVQLVRSGNTFTGSISSNGVNWVLVSSATVNLSPNAQAGFAVSSGSSSTTNLVVFDNVSVSGGIQSPVVTNPVPAGSATFAGFSREVEASRMTVNGSTGDVWTLETSSDLTTWVPLQTVTVINGQAVIEEGDPGAQPEMFFRVRSGN